MISEFMCISLVNTESYFDAYFNFASFYLVSKLNHCPKRKKKSSQNYT